MPKEKEIEKSFAAFYKKNAIDLCMFSYVQGFTDALPAVKIRDAITYFMKCYGIQESDYPIDTAVKNFSRINTDFIWKESK